MLKLSSSLQMAAEEIAKKMLENDIKESTISEMPSCLISQTNKCPSGYMSLGEINVKETIFYLFQMF
ncbi:MAG: hypothetical protein US70_C0004G0008 [Parcubacteria group bacterium GW2011_GWD2_38_11]|nr:MAG: hypothetical protein US70_C0004G0008 [Parcubacteria group bacterium GW2011_GWD2_38_11]